jgi:hypothetical protein
MEIGNIPAVEHECLVNLQAFGYKDKCNPRRRMNGLNTNTCDNCSDLDGITEGG